MREAKIFPELVGKRFGSDPEKTTMIPVLAAVNVTDFCSQKFVNRADTAVIEYSKLSDGQETVHFKTLFKGSGFDSFVVSDPYMPKQVGKDGFARFLRSSQASFLEDWGVNVPELVELVFQHSSAT
jgi:hypothetical protein